MAPGHHCLVAALAEWCRDSQGIDYLAPTNLAWATDPKRQNPFSMPKVNGTHTFRAWTDIHHFLNSSVCQGIFYKHNYFHKNDTYF